MLIFPDIRLVFLATPKAGSTAVEVALESLASVAVERPAALKHSSAASFERHIRPWIEAALPGPPFETVALMREPVEWLRSWYRFRRHDGDALHGPSMEGTTFADFARACVSPDPPPFARIGSQADFLTGGARVHHIFRYENIERFTAFLEDRLDCVISLPRVNASPQWDTSLTPEFEATLRGSLAREIALYESL